MRNVLLNLVQLSVVVASIPTSLIVKLARAPSAPLVVHGRKLNEVSVSSVAELTAAVSNSAVDKILVAAGTYELTSSMCNENGQSAICIDRALTIEAQEEPPWSVCLLNPPATFPPSLTGLLTVGGASWQDFGGGVYVRRGGVVNFEGCNIHDNSQSGDPWQGGGGVYVAPLGVANFEGCNIQNNNANTGGGVKVSNSAVINFKGGNIHDNIASERGGAVYFDFHAEGNFEDCNIGNNMASYGGGFYIFATTTTLANTSMYSNTATTAGPNAILSPLVDTRRRPQLTMDYLTAPLTGVAGSCWNGFYGGEVAPLSSCITVLPAPSPSPPPLPPLPPPSPSAPLPSPPPSPPSPPLPPAPFPPATEGKVWEGTIKFDLAVNYANRARTANADDVAEAVKVALADAGYPLGNGASIAGPVKSVKATPKARRRLDARRRLALTEAFTIEVVALAPLLPAISKLVRELGFLKEVRQALYDGGAISIVNEDPAEDNAKDLAASELGGAYSADDVTVTPVKNDDGTGTMTMTVNVAAKPDAQGAANKLSAVDPDKLKAALQPAEVVGPATAFVNPDGTVSWSFPVKETSLNPPVQAGKVSYPSGPGSLADASPAPSPPWLGLYQLAPYVGYNDDAHSCDSLCASKGLSCDAAMQASLTTPDKVTAAFAQAGLSCSNVGVSCGNDCNSDGAPFVYRSDVHCNWGAVAASCDQIPWDKNHRRVCACSPAPPAPPAPPPCVEHCYGDGVCEGKAKDGNYGCESWRYQDRCFWNDCKTASDGGGTPAIGGGGWTPDINETAISSGGGGGGNNPLVMYILTGVLGLFGLTLIVLLVVSCFTEKAKPQPNRTSTPNADGPVGWGPFGFLFPKSWVYVWWGYLAMVVLTAIVFPLITPSLPIPSGGSEAAEIILFIGPFIHCILMPFLWVHKHREDKKWFENHLNEDTVVMTASDPDAKTIIFSRKLPCGKKCKVGLLKLMLGIVDLTLRGIKYSTGGTIDLRAFWFPAPFYTFWKAKMQIDLIQINGTKICTNATQADAYMKFCTEAVLNFWTLGLYGKCCSSRTNYGRWLDRHVLWQGKPPEGYNNQFRIFDEKLPCCKKIKVYFTLLLLTLIGGFLEKLGLGGLWPFSLILPWYMYTVALDNMMFGGSKPMFAEEFTICNYIIKYYTIGCCGLCGFPVRVWVDKCIVMGEPKFDEEMAEQDAQADAANPKELSRRFSNQSASGPPSLLDPTRRVSFVSAEEQNRSDAEPQQVEVVVMQPESKKAAAPESLAALLAACGLEHHEETFIAEEYTLDALLSSMERGEEALRGDLRELKLTLGECRKLINHLGANK